MYTNRCVKKITNAREIIAKIDKIKDYELYNAKKAKKVKIHKEKWNETRVFFVEDHISNL